MTAAERESQGFRRAPTFYFKSQSIFYINVNENVSAIFYNLRSPSVAIYQGLSLKFSQLFAINSEFLRTKRLLA